MSKLGAHTRAQLVAMALSNERAIDVPRARSAADQPAAPTTTVAPTTAVPRLVQPKADTLEHESEEAKKASEEAQEEAGEAKKKGEEAQEEAEEAKEH